MPIYEYTCEACGHDLEALQKMNDEPLQDCPSCKQKSLRKKISAAAFRLKGGGWYETDFKSGSKKNLASQDSSSDAKSGGAGTGSKKADAPKLSSANKTASSK